MELVRGNFGHLSFVVLVGGAAVQLQLSVGIIAVVVLAHPGDDGEDPHVLRAQSPGEQEVHKLVVREGKAEVVQVGPDEGGRLHRRGLDDAVKDHPLVVVLQDPRGDQLGAVVAAEAFPDLERTARFVNHRTEVQKSTLRFWFLEMRKIF